MNLFGNYSFGFIFVAIAVVHFIRRRPDTYWLWIILMGGGIGALSTAFMLTDSSLGGRYKVTIYCMGWRLGGKGASGRNKTCHQRIEEHGLHIWFGAYRNAIALIKYENGAMAQFEVSWTFRGGLDLRDEVMGTEGTIWVNNFLRTGFEMFTTGKGGDYIAEKAESNSGWLFPVVDELNELGYNHMFMDMFNALEKGVQPKETFYDGYIVNSVLDAAYKSAKTKLWEPVKLDIWRGKSGVSKHSHLQEYDKDHYLVKEEVTHYGAKKVIIKNKKTGKISEKVLS